MGKYKINCDNILCKYYLNNHCSKNSISIKDQECSSFEKNLHYYFNLVWQKTLNTNMILMTDLDREFRLGLYYVMKVYDLIIKYNVRGNWEWLSLVPKENYEHLGLNYKEIISRETNLEELKKIIEDFNNNIFPDDEKDSSNNIDNLKNNKKNYKEIKYGLLSPSGIFYEEEWGKHSELAYKIIKENNWIDEYYSQDDKNNRHFNFSDFLVYDKNYVLIHNPYLLGNDINVEHNNFTKKQLNFLYDYFMDIGNTLKAEYYLSFLEG